MDQIGFGLPVSAKHDDCLWLHFLGNLPADILEDWVDGVVFVVHNIGLVLCQSRSRGSLHKVYQTHTPPWLKKYAGALPDIVTFTFEDGTADVQLARGRATFALVEDEEVKEDKRRSNMDNSGNANAV